MKSLKTDRKKNPFRVPDNYFEELNDRIMLNTAEKPAAAKSKGRALAMIRPWLSLAAVIAGVAVLTVAVLHLTGRGDNYNTANNTAMAEIPQFLLDGIDMYILELNMESETENNEPGGGDQHDDIIEYLMLSEIDFTVLYE
ncbi:MAG: hypothetical protein R6W67_11620, partial [Bacteroidales bacterium]